MFSRRAPTVAHISLKKDIVMDNASPTSAPSLERPAGSTRPNPLVALHTQGQSFWFDYISRHLIASGELSRLIREDGLRGMTSNPTIFEKAISTGAEYDADLKKAALKGQTNYEIFETLAVADIQKAADLLRPVHKSSGGADGYVSLEVDPNLAHDTAGTIAQAKRLFKRVARPNLMIKVPGTAAGLPAIEELIAAGLNINVTLLFSVKDYRQVLERYLRGLERRVKKKQPIAKIASVASFFVSRVDTAVDKILDQKISGGGSAAEAARGLLHRAAIANAKLAYEHYRTVSASPRFQRLRDKGAQSQRLLWASTSAKDNRLRDVVYVEELIGPETVNTMPPATVDAFRDHGSTDPRLTSGADDARESIEALGRAGIDLEAILEQIQVAGVQAFQESFAQLLHGIGAKAEALTGALGKNQKFSLGKYRPEFEQIMRRAAEEKWVNRLWSKDAALWKSDEAHAKIIGNSLGWLTVMDWVQAHWSRIESIVADVRQAKFTHILLLGMGGSSLCPEVLRLTFGKKTGYPDLAILDSTEPASVIERAKRSRPEKTLYIVASKSGSTTEPNAFLAYFYDRLKKKKGAKAGQHFIAITDPGTSMEKRARELRFRHVILNQSDIGGRYSALSMFGMVPAALMGIDVPDFLARAGRMADACSPRVPLEQNPGAALGAALGALALAGRDKVTFVLTPEIGSFGTWVEQLIAESTGKEGKGILPVESEPLRDPNKVGNDRVFVSIRTASDKSRPVADALAALEKAGHPVIRITLGNKADIGQEFFRWEIATAIASAALGIDAFDQPNVQESKDLTKYFLEKYASEGKLPQDRPVAQEPGLAVFAEEGAISRGSTEDALRSLFRQVKPGDYIALLAYIERNAANEAALQSIRESLSAATNAAVTVGFGPRFLHSTGQLHKGGGDNGVFLQITADDRADLPVPGQPYTFSVLKEAQALGDLSALKNKKRRMARVHLSDVKKALALLRRRIAAAVTN